MVAQLTIKTTNLKEAFYFMSFIFDSIHKGPTCYLQAEFFWSFILPRKKIAPKSDWGLGSIEKIKSSGFEN